MSTAKSGNFLKEIQKVLFMWGLPLSFLGFLLPLFSDSLGSTPLQIGLLYTSFSGMTILARPLIGLKSDRHGRKPFIIAGLFLAFISMGLLAFATDFRFLIIARILQGLAAALFLLVVNAAVADVSEQELRSHNFALVASSAVRGQLLGAFIGFAVFFTYTGMVKGANETDGIRAAFGLFSFVLILAFFLAIARLPETIKSFRHEKKSEVPFKLDRRWLAVLAATFSSACAGSLIAPLVMILLRDRHNASVNVIALTYIPMGLVWAFTPKYCARLLTRFGKLTVMAVSLITAGISTAMIPFSPALWILACLWSLSAMFDVAGNIAEQSYIADINPREHGGKGYGLYVMFNDIGAALGPLIGTFLYGFADWLAFVAATALFFATGLFVFILARSFSTRPNPAN